MAEIRDAVPGAHRRRAEARRHRRTPRRRPRASSSSSAASPRRTRAASTPRTSRRATTTGRARTSTSARPASTGRRSSPPPGSTTQTDFVVWQPGAVTGIAALVREPAARRPGRTTWPSTPSSTPPAVLPKAFVDEQFAFYGKALTGTPEAARPLEARRRRHERRARRGGRQALRRALLPAVGEGARRGDGAQRSSPPSASASTRLDWMAPRDQGARPRRSSRALKVGVGYPDKWRDYSAPRGRARRRPRQRRSAPRCSSTAGTWRSSASRSTAASG